MQPEADPDVGWVSALAGVSPAAAQRAVAEAQAQRPLFEHLARAHAAEGRRSYIEIDAPLELYAIARLRRPTHVVEVGVSSGVSSAYLLAALAKNRRGTLHSVDLPSFPRRPRLGRPSGSSWTLPPGRSSGWAVPRAVRGRWDLRLGDKRDVLPLLADELPRIDLFVYDVPHEDAGTWREFQRLNSQMPNGAVAIADHGPHGGRCVALARWARRRGAPTVRRTGLGLYGFRAGDGRDDGSRGAARPSST